MAVTVKICGITSEEALDAAIAAGADYAGFVFFKRSPRHLSLNRAAELAQRAKGRIETVALTVNPRYGLIKAIMTKVRPSLLQLHGTESLERVAAIRRIAKSPVIKAIKIGNPDDVAAALAYEKVADIVLFDAQPPKGSLVPGGNGLAFDWTWLRRCPVRPNFMLSGGLNSDNVLAAIQASGAAAIDVSSGVEKAPGIKSPPLIKTFVETAKSRGQESFSPRAA
jgi:phosphoribosylanthranilate isomerase